MRLQAQRCDQLLKLRSQRLHLNQSKDFGHEQFGPQKQSGSWHLCRLRSQCLRPRFSRASSSLCVVQASAASCCARHCPNKCAAGVASQRVRVLEVCLVIHLCSSALTRLCLPELLTICGPVSSPTALAASAAISTGAPAERKHSCRGGILPLLQLTAPTSHQDALQEATQAANVHVDRDQCDVVIYILPQRGSRPSERLALRKGRAVLRACAAAGTAGISCKLLPART